MSKYYEELPNLRVVYNKNQHLGESTVFEHCEYQISGDFCVIYQEIIKTVIPLIQISQIEYPLSSPSVPLQPPQSTP